MQPIKLENWVFGVSQPHHPPEWSTLSGTVYGHPYIPDGDFIVPSSVVSYDKTTDTFTTRSGNVYQLGQPKPDYEAAFPNAKERMTKQWEKLNEHLQQTPDL